MSDISERYAELDAAHPPQVQYPILRLRVDRSFSDGSGRRSFTMPAGTLFRAVPASNLPDGSGYWAKPPHTATEPGWSLALAEIALEGIGCLIAPDEAEPAD